MSFPAYSQYHESLLLFGQPLPGHWNLSRLGFLAWVRARLGWKGLKAEEYIEDGFILLSTPNIKERDIDFDNVNYISLERYEESPEIKLTEGDVLLAKDGSTLGTVNTVRRLPRASTVNSSIAVITPSVELNSVFLYYVFQSTFMVQIIETLKGGMGVPHLFQSDIIKLPLPLPSIEEQRAIAAFLDAETSKIDALVAEQRRLIELLKEKRQAVISHAVTKGLNPHVKMKPSGIDWLGEVPEHWELGRVKNYFQTVSGGTPNTDQRELYYADSSDGIPWIRTTDLDNDKLTQAEVFITSQALNDTACSILPPETVLVAMYGGEGTVGKNGILKISSSINQAICGILPTDSHVSEYLFRFMQFYRPYWMIGAESSRKDPNISQDRVRSAPMLKPPKNEQNDIVKYLSNQIDMFKSLAGNAQNLINLLQERRTALISAAVTGKIDVRHFIPKEVSA
jgi:type I restriction enzyme S subunit